MSSPSEVAALTYVKAWQEPDAVARARLVEACFAADGRIVSPGGLIRGPAALTSSIGDFLARGLSAHLASAIDVQGALFRFRAVARDREGRIVFDGFDTAEVGADGRIAVLLAFGGAPPAAFTESSGPASPPRA
jgi:hypothetical protein